MRIKRFVTAALLTASAASIIGVAAPAVEAAPSTPSGGGGGVSLNIDVDANNLLDGIVNAVREAQNVEGYMQSLREDAYINAGKGKYGVVVCKMVKGTDCQNNASAAAFKTANYNGSIFGVWLIREGSGTFHRGGDGGYQNWTFTGAADYDRDSLTATF